MRNGFLHWIAIPEIFARAAVRSPMLASGSAIRREGHFGPYISAANRAGDAGLVLIEAPDVS
jgi:hypothetical protein